MGVGGTLEYFSGLLGSGMKNEKKQLQTLLKIKKALASMKVSRYPYVYGYPRLKGYLSNTYKGCLWSPASSLVRKTKVSITGRKRDRGGSYWQTYWALEHQASDQESIPQILFIFTAFRHGMKVNAANNEGMTALDIVQQIPAQENPNVRNDYYRKRVTIIQQLKARKRANPASVTAMQHALIMVVGLIMAITYHAGLNPPGGFWQNLDIGNGRNHRPGKAIQSETAPWLFTVFLASDSLGFILSLALIPILMMLRKEMVVYVNSLVVVALISIEVAFILGLIMISDHKIFYRVEIFLLVLVTVAGIWWMRWKLKLSFMSQN